MKELRTETRYSFPEARELFYSSTAWMTIIEDYRNNLFIISEDVDPELKSQQKIVSWRDGKYLDQGSMNNPRKKKNKNKGLWKKNRDKL